jgi:hypothetical protein
MMGTVILFTAFCMRLAMNHCYVTSMDDSPFDNVKQCEAAIEWVDKMQWNAYYHAPPQDQNLCAGKGDSLCEQMCGNGNAPITATLRSPWPTGATRGTGDAIKQPFMAVKV